jgi:16S rRNA (uracil1498-N3)-methyltransferase
MTRRRWVADEVVGKRAILHGKNAHHLARVLRAKVGQLFDVVAEGRVREGRVASITDQRVEFELAAEVPSVDLPVRITLLLAIFKFDRMEWALEKATELGVARITPLNARRTEAHLASAAVRRVDRWRRIVHEAAQQARRASVPDVAAPLTLREALASSERGIVLAESERNLSLKRAISEMTPVKAVTLAVGPEGGWTNDELESFHSAGWRPASLGSTILRAETASIAALAVTIAELT